MALSYHFQSKCPPRRDSEAPAGLDSLTRVGGRCGHAGIPGKNGMSCQNRKRGIEARPSRLNNQCKRQKCRKVVRLRENDARFGQTGLQILLHALLGVETEGIMPAGLSGSEQQ